MGRESASMTFRNEADFQSHVMAAAKELGLLAYHTHRSQRSVAGFPDTVVVGHRGVLYRELKLDDTKLTPDQLYWIGALTEAGQNAAIWRPKHWPVIVLAEMANLGRLTTPRPIPTQAQVRKVLRGRMPPA